MFSLDEIHDGYTEAQLNYIRGAIDGLALVYGYNSPIDLARDLINGTAPAAVMAHYLMIVARLMKR